MRKIEIFKNVGSSWFSLGVSILVGIFLSPFILHRLGDTAFGIWVLIFSVTGYYGLFDLGIRSSVIRYVSTYTATDDHEGLAKLINTSLATYTAIGVVAMMVTLVCSFFVERLFRIPPEFLATARWLFLMVGSAVALGFPTGVFGGILEGMNRFYLVNVTNVTQTLLRAALIILALNHGYGLLMVAAITVVLPILSSFVRAAFVLHLLPIRFGWKYVDRGSLRAIANYSAVSFILMIAYKLRFKTDEIVIGTFLSVTAITYFSIGDRLLDYASEVVSSLAQIFVPMSGQSDARGDKDQLRKILVAGNRACALIIFPMTAVLIIMGKSVIEAWVGARYIAASYPVLVVLAIPMTCALSQAASTRILYGMARHRSLAWVTLMESIANLILSIVLIRPFGIVGDAAGTAIPLFCTSLYFMPRHLCRLLGIRIRTFLREAYTLPILLVIPFIAALLLMRRWFIAHTYLEVGFQIVACLVPYGAGLLWAFWSKRLWQVGEEVTRREMDEVAVALIEPIRRSSRLSPSGTLMQDVEQPKAGPKQWLRRKIPDFLLKERDTFLRLGAKAGVIYAWYRLLDCMGVRPQRRERISPSTRSVLFVCFGNIMRSPMAEAMFRQSTAGTHILVTAVSAGLHAVPGSEAHPRALSASSEIGLSLVEHRARLLTEEMVSQADVIFVMDFQNKAEVLALYPEARDKVVMLSSYADGADRCREIPDPYFGDLEATQRCYALLQTCIHNLAAELAEQNPSSVAPAST